MMNKGLLLAAACTLSGFGINGQLKADEIDDKAMALLQSGASLQQVINLYGQSPVVERYITITAMVDTQTTEGHGNGQSTKEPPSP